MSDLARQLDLQIAANAILHRALANRNLCGHSTAYERTCWRCQEADAALLQEPLKEGQRLLDIVAAARRRDWPIVEQMVKEWDREHPERDRFEALADTLAANPIKLKPVENP